MPIFTFRAKMGQERSLARVAELKATKPESGVYAILISDSLKGYAFIEGESQMKIEESMQGVKTLSSRAVGHREVPIEELGDLINPRPSIEGLEEGAIVEIVDGPFKGLRAKLTRIEEGSQEITAELLDSTMSLPVRIHADYVKRLAVDENPKKKGEYGKFSL